MDTSVGKFAIRVNDLVVGFGRRVVIDDLSLDVRRGEILGLVGASGGGKSVLMRTIIGLILRRSGEIEVMGTKIGSTHDRGTQTAAGKWGILFQQGALFSSLTARQNIQFPLRENLVLSDTLMDEMATAKLEMVGLTPEDGDKFPSELSGGMTKRVALARALALDPAIVFLDEPTSGLDPHRGRRLRYPDQDIAENPGPDGVHGDPRSRQPGIRSATASRRWRTANCLRHRADAGAAPIRTPVGAGLFPWQALIDAAAESELRMETRAPFVIIGAFVLAAIAAAFGFVYWLHNTGGLGPRTTYHVQFEGSVPGLLVGAAVLFNGIRVGEVTELSLAPDNPRRVNAAIAVTSTTPVRSDTKVGLDFQGLTGVPVIALEGGQLLGASGPVPTLMAELVRAKA